MSLLKEEVSLNLNLTKIKEFRFSLPSMAEQQEMVRRVKTLFVIADRLEAHYHSADTLVKQLTASLLAKAFRGELVEQEPNEEPGNMLLERIRAKRAEKPEKAPARRTARETKMTEDTIKDIIRRFSNDTFSFDELHSEIPGDYEQLKNIVFDLLSNDNPIISQVFDESSKAIRFVQRPQ